MYKRLTLGIAAVMVTALACADASEPAGPETPDGENVIGPDGGVIVFENVALDVPQGALDEPVEITVKRIEPADDAAGRDRQIVPGTAFDFGPDGLTFAQAFQLRIGYDEADLPVGVDESSLEIVRLGGTPGVLPSTVDAAGDEVRATAAHFSSFAVAAPIPTSAVCADLSPAATAGLPLDRVALGPAPATLQPPLLAEVLVDAEVVSATFVTIGNDGNAELIVPVHPSGSPDGGDVRLRVTDYANSCEPFDFTIEPMEPAPGELGAIAVALQGILDEQAAELGTSRGELVSTPAGQIPDVLVPMALMQSTLDHPNNPRSLAAIASGASPDAEEVRLDLLEPLVARTGLRAALEADLARRIGDVSATGSAAVPRQSAIDATLCTPGTIGDDPGLLDACMAAGRSAVFRRDGATGQVLGDISTALGVTALVPALSVPASVAGFVAWQANNEISRTGGLLPTAFAGMTIQPAPTGFLEDEDGPGSWVPAQVTATNQGWDLGKEMLEAGLASADVAGGFDKAQLTKTEISDVQGYLLGNQASAEFLEGGTIEEFQIPPETFGPVNVSDEMWSESEVVQGDAIARTSHKEYEPRAVGSAALVVRTAAGRFGGTEISENTSITVTPLDLDISPEEVALKAGEPQDFTVTVSDAEHPEMIEIDEDVPLQGTVEGIEYIGEGLHIVSYTAPAEPNPDSPDLLTVRHTAETGAREFSSVPRNAIATIRFADITISPRSSCLEPESSLQFSAEVAGLQNDGVEWSADVGMIDANGLYTAPPTVPSSGMAVITARSTEDSDIVDQVSIKIGGCSCSWSVLVDGTLVEGGPPSDEGLFIIDPGEGLFVIGLSDAESGQVVNFSATDQAGIPLGATGDFPISVQGNMGLGSGDLQYMILEAGAATLTLSENDGETVEGQVIGTVQIQPMDFTQEPRESSFTSSFRVTTEGSPGTDPVTGRETRACIIGSGS